jgi:hypothetical protein
MHNHNSRAEAITALVGPEKRQIVDKLLITASLARSSV